MNENDFLASYSPSDFERPSVAVDVSLVTVVDGSLRVLMIRRTEHPDSGKWQLPGRFLRDESPDAAAMGALEEKAGIRDVYVEQLYTFGSPDRDPRTRVISIAYYALVNPVRLATDTTDVVLAEIDVPWQGEIGGGVTLRHGGEQLAVAFDHADMIAAVVKRLRGKLGYSPIGYELLPEEFSLLDLQEIHETILGRSLNKDSFRRRMLNSGDLEATGHRQGGVGHRPAALYRYSRHSP
ncbi:bifunctional nicotinamide mononucleotide adenylyltransferase/ADP-ribose pyrophosphatase [bacterium BMS3Bbin02]|nr:bifunctional nicotinamide mononucleotide adenylyltransferase/ADP-ribose pyrophosphatase [bacterium BMS3Bbin02]